MNLIEIVITIFLLTGVYLLREMWNARSKQRQQAARPVEKPRKANQSGLDAKKVKTSESGQKQKRPPKGDHAASHSKPKDLSTVYRKEPQPDPIPSFRPAAAQLDAGRKERLALLLKRPDGESQQPKR